MAKKRVSVENPKTLSDLCPGDVFWVDGLKYRWCIPYSDGFVGCRELLSGDRECDWHFSFPGDMKFDRFERHSVKPMYRAGTESDPLK